MSEQTEKLPGDRRRELGSARTRTSARAPSREPRPRSLRASLTGAHLGVTAGTRGDRLPARFRVLDRAKHRSASAKRVG
jgi:hypothetical protein